MTDKILLNEAVRDIEEKRDQILMLLDEMENTLRDVNSAVGYDAVWHRAQAYWLTHIRSSLCKDMGNPYDVSVDNTISEIKELAESSEDEDIPLPDEDPQEDDKEFAEHERQVFRDVGIDKEE